MGKSKQFCNLIPQNVMWVFFTSTTVFFSLASSTTSDDQLCKAGVVCGSSQYYDKGRVLENFIAVMDMVSNKVNQQGWGVEAVTATPPAIYALGQCHHNLNRAQCSSCFIKARQCLPKCLPSLSGRIHLDGCFLRYDNYLFFNESVDRHRDKNICQTPTKVLKKEDFLKPDFSKRVAEVILNVTMEAGKHKFATGVVGGQGADVFALAQCWEILDNFSCDRCLEEAGKHALTCAHGGGGRGLYTGCFLRYSTRKFYNEAEEIEIKHPVERSKVGTIVAGVLSAVTLVLLIILGAFISWKKREDSKSNSFCRMPDSANKTGLHFKYELLEKATDFFDPSRKLGQGGAGSVFKGTLPTGITVAVKRLFFNTRQWVDEFFNEVNLISGIEHKNLVKLLGCSIEGPESLLIYEFLPNRSLDQILFGKDKGDILTWQQRFQIICGTAEGLAYLHGGSGTKIIHRDIKSSNILLDENYNPKIADFGLVRCIAPDKSHLSTGIAGTLGYMAPEYLIRGQLTEKADVYAFGVVVVEIVCGKKNSIFTQASASVLHSVWKNYKASNITASVDPAVQGEFSVEEALTALQAGLLCTQSSAALRPSMSEVVQMLTNKDYIIPFPKQPPFLNASVISPDDRTETSTMSSLFSNEPACEYSSFQSARSSTSSEHSKPDDSFSSTIGAPEPR